MTQPQRKPADAVAHGVRWRKLSRPKRWAPKAEGAEIVGYYVGQTLMDGKFGQYSVAMIAVPSGDGFSQPYTISGTALISAIDGGQIAPGQLLRVVYNGLKELSGDRKMKLFDVYAGEAHLDDATASNLFERMEAGDHDKVRFSDRKCGICRQVGHNRTRCPNKETSP